MSAARKLIHPLLNERIPPKVEVNISAQDEQEVCDGLKVPVSQYVNCTLCVLFTLLLPVLLTYRKLFI